MTSAGIAPTLGRGSVGLAWIHDEEPGGDGWALEVRGEVVPATVSVDPFYDPHGERLRS